MTCKCNKVLELLKKKIYLGFFKHLANKPIYVKKRQDDQQ